MKLATIETAGTTSAARVDGDGFVLLPYSDVGGLLSSAAWHKLASTATGPIVQADRVLTPVLAPRKVICVGLNYKKHIEESGEQTPEYPTLFSKWAQSLIGPTANIDMPEAAERVDWEAEMVAVIGAPARNVSVAEAEHAIAGFTVGNDISMRDFQARTSQWLQGKAFDRSTPVGPYLLTADESGPRPDLRITCSINGVMKQDSRTSDLLFGVPELISYISTFTELLPGDLVFTGTPGGVGQARPVPEFVVPGDVVVTEIESIGECRNRCES